MSRNKPKALESGGAANVAALESAASEFEKALVVIGHCFGHWVERCAAAAQIRGLSQMDLLILHYLRIRQRELRASDIAFALSIENAHLVTYSLRKLVKLGQLASRKSGKETLFTTSDAAEEPFQEYTKVRRDCLISGLATINNSEQNLLALAEQLRMLAGMYEQAARSAALTV